MASPSQGSMAPSWVTPALAPREDIRENRPPSFVMSGVARQNPNTVTHPHLLVKNTFTWKGPTWRNSRTLSDLHDTLQSYFCNLGLLWLFSHMAKNKRNPFKGPAKSLFSFVNNLSMKLQVGKIYFASLECLGNWELVCTEALNSAGECGGAGISHFQGPLEQKIQSLPGPPSVR